MPRIEKIPKLSKPHTMFFHETALKGCYLIDIDKHHDSRGFFARTWCQEEFRERELNVNWVQANLSFSAERGTLRGMHYQAAPAQEAKLIRCTRGAIYDVVIDLRPNLRTYRQWLGVELSASNYLSLYVPDRFAHGFITLENDTEVNYQMSEFYRPELERGVRYNDPAFGIKWPIDIAVIAERDLRWPDHISALPGQNSTHESIA